MRRRTIAGLLAPALVLLAFAPGAPARTTHTPVGEALAREDLLRAHDLGRGWSVASPAPTRVPPLTCRRFSPRTDARLEIGAAASPTLQASTTGPFVAQTAYAFATGAAESLVWRTVVRPPLLACVAEGLAGGSGAGVAFKISAKRLLAVGKLAVAAAGFSVTASATSLEVPTDVYLEAVVLGHGRTITEISVSGFDQGEARSEVLRLARLLAGRIARARSATAPPATR